MLNEIYTDVAYIMRLHSSSWTGIESFLNLFNSTRCTMTLATQIWVDNSVCVCASIYISYIYLLNNQM